MMIKDKIIEQEENFEHNLLDIVTSQLNNIHDVFMQYYVEFDIQGMRQGRMDVSKFWVILQTPIGEKYNVYNIMINVKEQYVDIQNVGEFDSIFFQEDRFYTVINKLYEKGVNMTIVKSDTEIKKYLTFLEKIQNKYKL